LVAFLTHELRFPPVWTANEDGLLAVGGDLSIERLVLAYRSGVFPWPIYDGLLTWFSPHPRAVMELDGLHASRSLRKTIRRGTFEVRIDTSFEAVVDGCAAATTERPSTWITDDMRSAYVELHQRGVAHSVEAWCDDQLAGGLYGISMGGMFAGESMFSSRTDASKVALHHLVEHMKDSGMSLLDVQVQNPHLASLGAVEIPRRVYIRRLRKALDQVDRF